MGVQGWQVSLSTSTYHTPSVCSSCLGPRETQVEAVVSEKNGNIRHTLKMAFPYCNACAARAKRDKLRTAIVLGVAALLGAGASLGALVALDRALPSPFVAAAIGLVAGAALATGLAFATRPGAPPPPATARGQAVILRDVSGIVLCTNQRFAELLGQANNATPTPGSTRMTTEAWAPITAGLVGVLALLMWARVAPASFRAHPSSSHATHPARR